MIQDAKLKPIGRDVGCASLFLFFVAKNFVEIATESTRKLESKLK
jgi:hypothetical protein